MDTAKAARLEQWRSALERRGVKPGTGASEAEIARAEARLGVVLPDDLRAFFLAFNGSDGGEDDIGSDCMAFHRVDQLHRSDIGGAEPPGALFSFANVLLWSHTFAVRLGPVAGSASPVYQLGYGPPRWVADSFAQFMVLYAAGREDPPEPATGWRLLLLRLQRFVSRAGSAPKKARSHLST